MRRALAVARLLSGVDSPLSAFLRGVAEQTRLVVPESAKNALQKAKIPILGNVDPYITQTIPSLTTGSRTNGAVNGASQGVTYLSVKSTYQQTLNINGVGASGTVKRPRRPP